MKQVSFSQFRWQLLLLYFLMLTVNGFAQNTLTVNVDQATTPVQKTIYSGLLERLGRCINGGLYVGTTSSIPNVHGMRKDIIAGFKECGIEGLQWPGGCAANSYSWVNNTNPSNDMGTDHFFELCDSLNCEPYLTVPPFSTKAPSNLGWMKYINNNSNHPDWTIKYVKVGNEVWGTCGGNMGAADYIPQYLVNYDSLRKTINNKPIFIVAGNGHTGSWTFMDSLVKQCGSKMDGIEFHNYLIDRAMPSLTFTDNQYYNILNKVQSEIRPHMDSLFRILNKYDPNKKIQIMWDEWGEWLLEMADVSTLYEETTLLDALSSGVQLNLFMNYPDRIRFACAAQVINVLHSLFHTNKTNGELVKTPVFYVFKMYKPHHTANAKVVPLTLKTDTLKPSGSIRCPALSAFASIDSLNNLNISLTNIDLVNSRTLQITLSTATTFSISQAQIVTGSTKNAYNNFGQPEQVNLQTFAASNYSMTGKTISITIPSKSVVMLRLAAATSVKLPGTDMKQLDRAFSIVSKTDGSLQITSLIGSVIPVTFSLYGIDGRTLFGRVSKTFRPQEQTLLLSNNQRSGGVFLVKIAGADFSLSKKIIINQ